MTDTLWAQLDPETTYSAPTSGGPTEAYEPSISADNGLNFYHPDHPLFGFGVVVGLTAACLYIATEKGAGAGISARLGRAKAGASVGLEGEKK